MTPSIKQMPTVVKKKILIGIDPGKNTGFALFDPVDRSLTLQTLSLHKGFFEVLRLRNYFNIEVVIENPNLWTHFSPNDKTAKARLKGVGSVMRDYSAWTEFFEDYGIPYKGVRPDKTRNGYATDTKLFQKITGYNSRCTEHARVAAMLVWR